MTVILGLRVPDGVVLASDSQRTHGGHRQVTDKVFRTEAGIIYGVAGAIAVAQELPASMQEVEITTKRETKANIIEAMNEARDIVRRESDRDAANAAEALFGWCDREDSYLLRVGADNVASEFFDESAVGSVARLGLFAFALSDYLDLQNLSMEGAKTMLLDLTTRVIDGSAASVSRPVQMATVTRQDALIVRPDEMRALQDTVAAVHEDQRGSLDRLERGQQTAEADPGVRPPD